MPAPITKGLPPCAPLPPLGGNLMIRWIQRAARHNPRSRKPASPWKRVRLGIEWLEDRTTPATMLASPTLLDPVAPIRVDLSTFAIRGSLVESAKNGTTVQAYRDSNHNGA